MNREPTSPLFVRLPAASAEKLNRAAFELKTPKRELVTELVDRYLGADDMVIGRAAPESAAPEAREPDVLTLGQLAQLLQVEEATVRSLAAKGDLPGRRLGRDWRFSRQAVLDWLATPERRRRVPGFEG
jgi:excisionase family DNA binding protein